MNKITCNVIKDILPLYIDGVVSEDTKKIVDEHLAECSLCRDEMNKLKKTLVIPTNEEIQQETVNVLEKSISSIERTVVKKFIHYSSYFDLIFNIGMIPFIYWLYVIWIKKETSLLNIYVFIKKYSRISGDLLSFAFVFCNIYLLRYYPYCFNHEKETIEYYGFGSCDVNYGKVISYSYSNGIFNGRYINVRGRIHVQSCMEKL